MQILQDSYRRVHDYLRISLIDRCNLNCFYCNPKHNKTQSVRYQENLTLYELHRLVRLFVCELGVKKVRFTGGEPMIRKDIIPLFERVGELKRSHEVQFALTSNGTTLAPHLETLRRLGLDRLNISLDTLDRKRFEHITGHDKIYEVMQSIDKAEEREFRPLKINAVGMRGINDAELADMVSYFKDRNVNLRFIEFMPFGNNDWENDNFISCKDMKSAIESRFSLSPLAPEPNTVAKDFAVSKHKCTVSFISPISDHFCASCNRLRVGSSGKLKLCLLSGDDSGLNIRDLFRSGADDKEIAGRIQAALQFKKEVHPPVQRLVTFSNNQMMAIGG